jgi:hypothetical protein
MKPQNKVLENWEKATNELLKQFLDKYFNEEDYEPDWYWISNAIGETVEINDYFFNLDRIVEAIRYNASKKKLFDFYDLELDYAMNHKPMEINFYHYLKRKK